MQHYTIYFIWKLVYMFRLVPSPIITRANNCIYRIWYLSHRYCYLPLSRQVADVKIVCFRNKKKEYLKAIIHELNIKNKLKNIERLV